MKIKLIILLILLVKKEVEQNSYVLLKIRKVAISNNNFIHVSLHLLKTLYSIHSNLILIYFNNILIAYYVLFAPITYSKSVLNYNTPLFFPKNDN